MALAAVVGAWRVRRHGASVTAFMDGVAPALLVAQAIGRIGNYFNQELFGGPTSLPWGLEIAPAFRPAGYARYPAFHPTFPIPVIARLVAPRSSHAGRGRKVLPSAAGADPATGRHQAPGMASAGEGCSP